MLSPRWLGALALAALFAVAAYHLGFWQYHRHEAKVERNARLDAHYRADPVAVTDVVTPTGMPASAEWTRVTVTGRYSAGPLFARGRPNEGEVGLEVLWALTPDGGGTDVLVDRGWVPASGCRGERPARGPPGTGRRGDRRRLGPPERADPRARSAASGSIANLSVPDASDQLGTALLPDYVLLESETLPDGSSPPRPAALAPPDRSLGPHLAYAYQWWFGTVVGFVLVGFGIRREERLAHPEKYPPKPKKVRIWDEEDG